MNQKPLKIYNASAGSGKTYTLVMEYLRIILHSKDDTKFRRVLAMTFTNKAANEMKERILQALEDLGTAPHDQTEKQKKYLNDISKQLKIGPKILHERSAKVLNRILHNYGAFSIMTIDKFTHKIIRTFARDLNLSVDFDVELDLHSLRKEVTDLLFDKIGRDKELTRLMLRYVNRQLQDDKSWDFSKQLLDFSKELFKEEAINSIQLLNSLSGDDFLRIQSDLIAENEKLKAQAKNIAKQALDLMQQNGLEATDFQGLSNSIFTFFYKVSQGDKMEKASNTIYKNVEAEKWGHPKSPNKGIADSLGPELRILHYKLDDFFEKDFPKYALNQEILKNINNLSLLNHFLKIIEEVKEEENTLLISDFYKKIAEIITEEPVPFIYERLGVRYEHFLLDEFQDTSHLQWINLIPLLHNSLASANTNLIVGDGKQAIYRWRNGEVEQFMGLPNRIYNPEGIASLKEAEATFSNSGELFPLQYNYRSGKEIVTFNNELFKALQNHLDESLKPIFQDIEQKAVLEHPAYVSSLFQKDMTDVKQLEYIINSIEAAFDRGYESRDICIICRYNSKGSMVGQHLSLKGYKVISSDSLFLGKSRLVKLIISLMNADSNASNQNHKVKALEHYAINILDQDPAAFLANHQDLIRQKNISGILKEFDHFLPVYQQYHNLYEYTEALMDAFDLNVSTNVYLQTLLEQVHLFEKRNNSSRRDFLDWFNDKGAEISISNPENANAIQIMTIHKSKGLQFPVVICPYMDWAFELQKQISWVQSKQGEEIPAYFVKITKGLQKANHEELYEKEKGKFMLDNLNLLYVAFTRAENVLFISGKFGKSNPTHDWLLPFFEDSPLFVKEGDSFSYGTFAPKQEEERDDSSEYTVVYSKEWMDKPQLSFRASDNWDVHELDRKREYGNKVHAILAKLHQQDELASILKADERKGKITLEEVDSIQKDISELFEEENFARYYREGKARNEVEIVDLDGKKQIPDRLIFKDDELLVVDFKTGQKNPSHKKQLQGYIKILKDMGYSNIKGELYYTQFKEVMAL
jgi:ATP-dependent exoDNAse (exonuclease V) beta subunit